MPQKTVSSRTQQSWQRLWNTEDDVERIKNRYKMAVQAAELCKKSDALASDVRRKLKVICKSPSVVARVLEVGSNVKTRSVELMVKHAKNGDGGASWSHLVETRGLSEKDRLSFLNHCVKQGIGSGRLHDIISEECVTVRGGRREVRVTELSRQLNRALSQAVKTAESLLDADTSTAVANVKKRYRKKAIEKLNSISDHIQTLDELIERIRPFVADAVNELQRLEES